MKSLGADEIRRSFINSTRGEVARMALPRELEATGWDDLDFLGWVDPAAPDRAYVVVPTAQGPVGIALKAAKSRNSRSRAAMCQFCVCTRAVADITLYSARLAGPAGKLGNVVGSYVCTDLACSLYVRGRKRLDVPQPAETLDAGERAERLATNVRRFVDRVAA